MLGDFDLYKDRIVITPYYCHPLVWLWFHKMISNHLYHQYEARYLAPEWWSVAMTTLEAVWPLNLVTEVQHELLEIFDKWSSDIKKRVALPTDIPDAVALLEKYKSRAPNQETIEAEGIWQVIILIFGSESRSDHATVSAGT
ncbi:MAG: uncharacterized protein KVP18_004512 [Porospora cf. gigantea A]|uniref:uncharacterized protein n=1 Tax=Porospora cf. gigantea A TaxID=2853593 RepID=UPI00355A5271|nr:MAG: hypothetical protein KVP18_004512 [Porospora cf. gigantea A]